MNKPSVIFDAMRETAIVALDGQHALAFKMEEARAVAKELSEIVERFDRTIGRIRRESA